MDKALREKIDACINTMPSLPVTMPRVLELCNNPRTSSADLTRVISLDPVLLGRVHKLVNLAYCAPELQAANLIRAVIMLGLNTVKNLALSTAMTDNFYAEEFQGFDLEGYWRHSLCVGVAARLVARKRGVDPGLLEQYYAAGLLHDIGKLPLNAALPGAYPLAVKKAGSRKLPLFQVETETMGLNHAGAGEVVAKAWHIEGALGDAVIHHHNYTEYAGEHRELLHSIVAANYFAALTETGFSGDRHPPKPEPMVWETLGLAWEDLEGLKPMVDGEIKKAQAFLNL
jgi:HD-like signal output (HDOD) protein